MIKVYICSPYRADTPEGIQANKRKAKQYCKIACKAGYIPIAPHLYFTRFLKDSKPDERELGMQIGIELLKECKEVWACGGHISAGMRAELTVAKQNKIPVRFFFDDTELEEFIKGGSKE